MQFIWHLLGISFVMENEHNPNHDFIGLQIKESALHSYSNLDLEAQITLTDTKNKEKVYENSRESKGK